MLKLFCKKALVTILVAGAVGCFAFADSAADAVKQKIIVEPVAGLSDDFMMGVDISSLYDVERCGGKYYNAQGKEADLFEILKENGVNWIRLRVWNKPFYAQDQKDWQGKVVAKKGDPMGGGNNSLDVDIPLAVRAKKAGMKLLVNFHYSDSWADPEKQTMPQEWAKMKPKDLNAAVEKFTRESLDKFVDAGAQPDAVQIGNELNGGFMWPLGKTWADKEKGETEKKIGGMSGFMTLLKSAAKGVRASKGGKDEKIIIHLADGGDNGLYRWVFDEVKKQNIDFDIIGLSFYVFFHATTTKAAGYGKKNIGVALLKENLDDLAARYPDKKIAVVETSYAFTLDDGDEMGNNFIVFSEPSDGYAVSVQGQATAIRDVIDAVASVKTGCGVFYWEPAWLPVKGAKLTTVSAGNTWENQAMFDYKGRVLPSLAVWNLVRGGNRGKVQNAWGGSAENANTSELTVVATADVNSIVTTPKTAPKLPSQIKMLKSNGREYLMDVTWESHDWASETSSKKIKLSGRIAGVSIVPQIEVIIDSKVNLVEDNSFESGKQYGKWNLNGNSAYCYLENNKGNAHTGNWSYKYWSADGFKSNLSQKFTGLENGTYTLSVWAMGGGGEKQARLMAMNYGGEKQLSVKIENTGWQKWKQYHIDIPVTNGECTIAIYLDTNPDCWGNFDDVEFYKKD